MLTAKDIAEKLARQAEQVAKYLLPNGKRMGQEWLVGSLEGEGGGSLKIHLCGAKAGVWCDFASGTDRGDILDLWAKTRGVGLREAIQEASAWLGIREPEFHAHKKREYQRPAKPKCNSLKVQSPVMAYLTQERKLSPEALGAYKIAEAGSEIVFPSLRGGELIAIKYLSLTRENGKKKIRVEAQCEPCLFGWQAIPEDAREVTICEGEIDAMTLWHYGYPSLSVPFGGGKGAKQQWIEYEYDNLVRFDSINLCFDQDKEGQIAAAEIAERLGRHRCKVVQLPCKDANECLQHGFEAKDIQLCFSKARTLDPEALKNASEYLDEVIQQFYPPEGLKLGFKPPWAKSEGKLIFRPSELSIWTGINGHGKSMFLSQLMLHAMEQGEKVCIASMELKPRVLLARMAKQVSANAQPSREYLEAIHAWYQDKLWIFDVTGTAKGEWILDVFRYARQRYGITQYVVDSLMKCGIGEDDYNSQKLFVEKLADFKNEFDVHVHLVAHARKSENEAHMPGKLDVKGTGTITDLTDNAFCVWRNKAKEEENRKAIEEHREPPMEYRSMPDALLICDKSRNGEWEGRIGFFWSDQSFQYLENNFDSPRQFIRFQRKQSNQPAVVNQAMDILNAEVFQ